LVQPGCYSEIVEWRDGQEGKAGEEGDQIDNQGAGKNLDAFVRRYKG
jgi:hypothetical protein